MSRFIDQLNRLTKATSQPMGFRSIRPITSEPKILLAASLAQSGDASRLADGADAILLRLAKSGVTAKMLQKIATAIPTIPWGAWLTDIDTKKLEALIGAGCDFVVFPPDSRVSATPQEDKVGKILQVEPSLSDGLLRAVNDLPVDAVLAANTGEDSDSIAWHHLMLYQRLANLLTKPLLATATLKVTAGELKALWEAGVDGVVVEVGAGQPGGLSELRRAIGELTFRPSRKRGKAEALLPRIGGEGGAVTEEEEGEEEEYE